MTDAGEVDDVTPENSRYANFIESELKAERDRKAALDTRGGSLVTSSGAIFAILVGVGSVGRVTGSQVPDSVGPLLILALISFLASGIVGICVQWNRKYEVVNERGLTELLTDLWREPQGASMRRISANYLRTIGTLRSGNGSKEVLLRWGYSLQVAAIVFLGPVAFIMIATR